MDHRNISFFYSFFKKSKIRKMKILVLIIALVTYGVAQAQFVAPQVVNTTGNTFKKGYYSLDWSIGEVPLVDQFVAIDQRYIVTNGFLQAFTDSPDAPEIPRGFGKNEIIILPNPTSGRLEVNFFLQEKGQANLVLYDAVGGRLLTRTVAMHGYGRFERFDLTGLAGSTYFLYIEFNSSTGNATKKGSYKISKIK
jgi:hypothetical protein